MASEGECLPTWDTLVSQVVVSLFLKTSSNRFELGSRRYDDIHVYDRLRPKTGYGRTANVFDALGE